MDAQAIRGWLVTNIAALLDSQPDTIDPHALVTSFGLSSAEAVSLSGELADWLGTPLSPLLVYEHPTIDRLAHHLAESWIPADDSAGR